MQSNLVLVARLTTAAILAQSLAFKFTGAAESVAIFEALGAEPWGRLASGAVEALAVALLLVPRFAAVGAPSPRGSWPARSAPTWSCSASKSKATAACSSPSPA